MNIHRFIREPLLHFLLIGAAIFFLYDLSNEEETVAPDRIVISSGEIEQLSENFKRSRMRSPTETEMDALVDNFVREEVFYREALAMGLDQNDKIVRKRMNMKLDFILEDISSQDVTDEKLILFMEENSGKFHMPAQISFKQIYLDPKKRNDLDADAKRVLAKLADGKSPELSGDRTLLPYEHELVTQVEISNSFGNQFAENIIELTPGKWMGPIDSEYGVHLVKITKHIQERKPNLAEIRTYVEREYLSKIREEQKELAYQNLREGYDIIIEPLKTSKLDQVQ